MLRPLSPQSGVVGVPRHGRHLQWKKVLYERQTYPDNHVDETFMASLVTNANKQEYDYFLMLTNTTSIVHHVCVMVTAWVVYSDLRIQIISASSVIFLDFLLVALMYLSATFTLPPGRLPSGLGLAKNGAIFGVALLGLSPVLQTLTKSFSLDTIWALTIMFCAVALMSHDYTFDQPHAKLRVRGTLSLNAAMFASVLLASRLDSAIDVFAIEVLCICMFALEPMVRQSVQMYSVRLHAASTAVFALIVLLLLYSRTTVLAVSFLCAAAVWLVCPLIFLAFQKYKNEIRGPWDIAKVRET